ncbi:Protein phosphatase 2C-like protein 2 [Elsinoe fawcettii]|nr:Protein phosphatase 2C-like protein 2 [Elsinoe fawcettii]
MRRAVVQNLRFLRRPIPKRAVKSRLASSSNVFGQRSVASRAASPPQMRSRRVSQAVIGAAVAGGAAWYAYKGTGKPILLEHATPPPSVTGPIVEQIPEAVRKALIVERGELYTSIIPEGQPLSKETDDHGRKVLEMMNEDQVTAKLRTNEESYLVGRGKGVVRYDVVQIPSNDPIEDDHAEKIIDVPESVAATDNGDTSSDWMFWGVFDGHSGWTTSAKLRQVLISYVARELNTTYSSAKAAPGLFPSASAIDEAIKTGFNRLDHEIVHESAKKVLAAKSKPLAAQILQPALSGSCALLSFYDSRSKELRVACTGDSRAVLGRRSTSGKWSATPLSIDQTGGTESEAARLRAEHPNEPYVTANGRILGGLEPSRAFGDAVYKWSIEVQGNLGKFFARRPSKHLLTPPYVTAEPIVTTTKISPENGGFVVMATDGLWEMLTNEEVIGLVGMWLEKHGPPTAQKTSSAASWLPSWLGGSKSVLPVEGHAEQSASDSEGGQRAPVRQQQWGVSGTESQRFVVEDKNAATHLVRNALGGKDKEMLSALLTLPSPMSRRYRDDLTVEVIFFGEGEKSGKVELNREASATVEKEIKAKL